MSLGPGAISPFIKVMLLLNGGVFIAQYFLPQIPAYLGFTPALFLTEFYRTFYQPLTYMFVHGGLGHVFFNLLALWMFGTEIEFTWGTRAFARFYFLCGLAGAALTLAVFPHQQIPVVGASGAIFGVLVAYWLMFPNRYVYLYFLLPIKVKWFVPGMLVLGVLLGGEHVAHMAHLGGALCGLIYLKMDWRWNWLGRRLKDLRYRRKASKLEKRRHEADEIMRRVDAILDKINEVGMENLTKAERKFLEEASSHLSKHNEHRER
ncbi:MAG: rhomboid family intramembrane serine protease [Candidatus Zixiibacteriota bacterium]